MAKSTNAVVAARVEKVLELLLAGANALDIAAYASAPGTPDAPEPAWGLSDRQLRTYVQKAGVLAKQMVEKRADRLLALHILRRERLYAHAMDVGDYRTCLAILADEAKLMSLYPPKRLEHSGPNGGPVPVNGMGRPPDSIDFTDEELLAIIAGDAAAGEKLKKATGLDPQAVQAFAADMERLEAIRREQDAKGQPPPAT